MHLLYEVALLLLEVTLRHHLQRLHLRQDVQWLKQGCVLLRADFVAGVPVGFHSLAVVLLKGFKQSHLVVFGTAYINPVLQLLIDFALYFALELEVVPKDGFFIHCFSQFLHAVLVAVEESLSHLPRF